LSFTLPQIARALGGEISAGQVLAPGPGHSMKDRSLAVKVGDTGKLVVSSFAGDDYQRCLQHVESKLGIVWQPERANEAQTSPIHRMQARVTDNHLKPGPDDAMARKQAFARQLWSEAVDPRGTIVETYLASRGLIIPDDAAMEVIRFHPTCSFGKGTRHPCMVAAFHSIETGEVVAIHRTALTPEGAKINRLTLGPMGGAAIKLSRLDPERGCLAIGEGIESTLAGLAMGFSPAWAMGSAGNIVKLPVLPGVDTLTILGERDGGANAKAVQQVGSAWSDAGREVLLAMPKAGFGDDANDAWRISQDSSGIEVTDFAEDVGPIDDDGDEDDRPHEADQDSRLSTTYQGPILWRCRWSLACGTFRTCFLAAP
jgi:putative DNA primase/helicase